MLAVEPEAVARYDPGEAVSVAGGEGVCCAAPFMAGDGDAGVEGGGDVGVEVGVDVGQDGGGGVVGYEDLGCVGEEGCYRC